MKRTILALIAGVVGLVGLTTAPASAAPQQLRYYGPDVIYVGAPASELMASGDGNRYWATITSQTPSVCTVSGRHPSEYKLRAVSAGTCTLRFQVPGGNGFDPIDTTRAIPSLARFWR